MNDRSRAVFAWAAILVPTWLVLVLCTHWEPVIGDGWGHVEFHTEQPLSLGGVWTFAKYNYLEMNPRLGQTLTMLLFTPGPWHAIVTPLVELALFYLLTALAIGRLPRRDDALVFATIFALVAACAPLFGQMLFYRPYTGNYLYGLVLCVGFLVPYRCAPAWGWAAALPMLVLGAAAGLSNEHTGPAFALAALAATIHGKPRAWQIAGLVGIVAGGLALFFAPGQDVRYSELATHDSLLGRIASRGLGNGKPFGQLIGYLTPALAWIALALAARRAKRAEPMPRERAVATLALAAMALLVVVTLLASPKLGLRLLFASVALACTAVASFVTWQLVPRWSRVVAWVGAAGVIGYVLVRCVLVYHTVGAEYAARIDTLEHAPPHSRVTLPVYSVGKSRFFFGDDFLLAGRLESIAQQFSLDAVELRDHRAATPVGDEP